MLQEEPVEPSVLSFAFFTDSFRSVQSDSGESPIEPMECTLVDLMSNLSFYLLQ